MPWYLATTRRLAVTCAMLMLTLGLVLAGCGTPSEVEKRQADCATAQDVVQKMQNDMRTLTQDLMVNRNPMKAREQFRTSASDLRNAAGKMSDQKLKNAFNEAATRMEIDAADPANDPMTTFTTQMGMYQAILGECTRVPGK